MYTLLYRTLLTPIEPYNTCHTRGLECDGGCPICSYCQTNGHPCRTVQPVSDILIASRLQQLGLQTRVEAASHIETGTTPGCSTPEPTALSESIREFGPVGVCGHDGFGNDP